MLTVICRQNILRTITIKNHYPINYRPISLTCIICKLLEHVVTSSIMKHLEYNNILYDLQHGFRSSRSCETQLVSFIQDLAKSSDKNIQTDLIIMDFAKAFDKVSHNISCTKSATMV